MKHYKFDSKCIEWIESWLTDRTCTVNVNGNKSSIFHASSGVPGGSVLGPLLFLIYVNDISQSIQNSDCRLYADDTILCSEVINDAKSLQEDINELKSWADTWGMIFNHKKCVHVKVGSDCRI